jgi:hypothetical protein
VFKAVGGAQEMKEQTLTTLIGQAAVWQKVEKGIVQASAARTGKVEKTLVQNFVSLRSLSGMGSAFAFTSTRRGEGVSHVIQALGNSLALYSGVRVLVISFLDLVSMSEFEVKHLEETSERHGEPALIFHRKSSMGPGLVFPIVDPSVWTALRARYQYILIDCPALESGSHALSLGNQVDGTVLVVRAGYGTKRQIQQATRLLSFGSNRLLGCILNRRTYPIPNWLYRWI